MNSYGELLGSAAEVALAMPAMTNTPQTSVPTAFSTLSVVRGVQRQLKRLGVNTNLDGNLYDQTMETLLRLRFGPRWRENYTWVEVLQGLQNDVRAGKSFGASTNSIGYLSDSDMIPTSLLVTTAGMFVAPLIGIGVLWYFLAKKG